MYLTKKTYVKNWDYMKPEERHTVTVLQNDTPVGHIKAERIKEISEDIGYWCKANHIHKWFVANCQSGEDDCRDAYVSREQLQSLLDICKEIKEKTTLIDGPVSTGYTFDEKGEKVHHYEPGKILSNPEIAAALLPTESGFFFGSTEYDEYYIQDIDDTIKILESALSEPDDSRVDYSYHSSW